MLTEAAKVADPSQALRSALLSVGPLAAVSVALYARWLAILKTRGGRVSTERFSWPDLIVTFLVGGLLGWGAFLQLRSTKPVVVNLNGLVATTIVEVCLLIFLGGFLYYRKVHVAPFLGLRIYSPARLLGRAALFLVCAIPIMLLATVIVQAYLQAPAGGNEEQQIVIFFRERAKAGDFQSLIAVSLTAVVMAPFFEELFFRGYFYPTIKRYVGPIGSALLVSALFAFIHANLVSCLPLFILALCLTMAYEWTGSLVVSMSMHAVFNGTSLALMYWAITHPQTPGLSP